MILFFNSLLFYAVWWGILVLQSRHLETQAVVLGTCMAIVQILLIRSQTHLNLLQFVMKIMLISIFGFLVDHGLEFFGLLKFYGTWPFPWLFLIWVNFALTLDGALGFLKNKIYLTLILGSTAAPLSYYLASLWGVLDYPQEPFLIGLHMALWAVLMLCIVQVPYQLNAE